MKQRMAMLATMALVAGLLCWGCAGTTQPEPGGTDSRATYPLQNQQHAALNMQCETCHSEPDPTQGVSAVQNDTCLSCHRDYEKLAERTANLGEGINPHNNFHYDAQLDCVTCHSSHSESHNLCTSCHDTDVWMNQNPETLSAP